MQLRITDRGNLPDPIRKRNFLDVEITVNLAARLPVHKVQFDCVATPDGRCSGHIDFVEHRAEVMANGTTNWHTMGDECGHAS